MSKYFATIHNANIRGHEVKKNAKGEPYCLVKFEDEKGDNHTLCDKDEERFEFYKKNENMDLIISIYESKNFTTIRIEEAKIVE